MPHTPASINLLLGCAFNYSNQDIFPFLNSLQTCGYTDDLVLLTNDQSDICLKNYSFNGTTINVDEDFRQYSSVDVSKEESYYTRILAQVEQKGPLDKKTTGSFYHHYFLMTARYFLYDYYLSQWDYTHIFLTDVNDVFFQKNPFEKQYADGVTVFAEYEGILLREEETNHDWVQETFGSAVLQQMGNEVVYCAGTILLKNYTKPFLKDFLNITLQHQVSPVTQGVDQAVLNYLVSYMKRDYFHRKPNGDTVLTVANVPEELIAITDKGMMLKGSHQLPDVVHQYTRFANQKQYAIQRFPHL